jgi:hypothetical protein
MICHVFGDSTIDGESAEAFSDASARKSAVHGPYRPEEAEVKEPEGNCEGSEGYHSKGDWYWVGRFCGRWTNEYHSEIRECEGGNIGCVSSSSLSPLGDLFDPTSSDHHRLQFVRGLTHANRSFDV